MGSVGSPTPALAESRTTKPSNIALLLQFFALVFAVPAVAWGVFIVWSTAFPPKCGDWSGMNSLGVVECWVVDLPAGLMVLAVGLFVKRGSLLLRRICIISALAILALPIISSILLHGSHCP